MRPGLRMMMMQGGQDGRRMDYDDPNRRRIGFGANEHKEPRPGDPMHPAKYADPDRRWQEPLEPRKERRDNEDDPRRMMGGDYPIPEMPEMRRRRDERGRYMGDSEMTYPSNITPLPRVYPQRASMHEPQHERNGQEPVRAGGEFWMIPPAHEKKLTREKAEKWVRKMARHGESWTFEDAKRLGMECGVPEDKQSQIDFFAALNMMASDYRSVAAKFGIDEKKFFSAMAMAFLHDEDGKPPSEKLAAYYKYVVPQDDEDA